jgi:antitoxin PrlF
MHMPTATLTSNGRITLPPAVRTALGLTAGQKIAFLPEGDSFRVVALCMDVSVLRGRFAGRVKKSVSIAEMDAAIAAGATGGRSAGQPAHAPGAARGGALCRAGVPQ